LQAEKGSLYIRLPPLLRQKQFSCPDFLLPLLTSKSASVTLLKRSSYDRSNSFFLHFAELI
jgi:hypothetical protein